MASYRLTSVQIARLAQLAARALPRTYNATRARTPASSGCRRARYVVCRTGLEPQSSRPRQVCYLHVWALPWTAPGSYQSNFNSSGCILCAVAFYCPGSGTTSPTPCPGGTWSNVSGLYAELQCASVASGFWAPTGSKLPEECPESGFKCPGRAQDEVNDPPGSKPILVDAGQASVDVEVDTVTFSLELYAAAESYDESVAIAELAAYYEIDASLISIEATSVSAGRRRMSNDTTNLGSRLRLAITVIVPGDFENSEGGATSSGSSAAPTPTFTADMFASHLAGFSTPLLFGVSTSLTQVVSTSTLVRQDSSDCPMGYCEVLPFNTSAPMDSFLIST